MIHFEAKRLWAGTGFDDRQRAHGLADTQEAQWFLMSIPLVIIVVLMLIGYSPGYSAFVVATVSAAWLSVGPPRIIRWAPARYWDAMMEGARNTLIIGATVGVIGIIVGTISAHRHWLEVFSDIIISMSGGIPAGWLLY